MRRALIAIVAPAVVLGGIAISRGAREVRDIKQTIETFAYELENSAEPVALSVGFLPMYVDGDRIGKLQTVVVQRAEAGAVDSLLVLVEPSADGLGEYAECSFRFDPDAFDHSGPMGFRHAVDCVTADEVAEDGLVRFGTIVFEGIGHQAGLYLEASDLPCGHSSMGVEACNDLRTELQNMKRELRDNLRRELRGVRGRRGSVSVTVDLDEINAEVQRALEQAQKALEEVQVEVETAEGQTGEVQVRIKNR